MGSSVRPGECVYVCACRAQLSLLWTREQAGPLLPRVMPRIRAGVQLPVAVQAERGARRHGQEAPALHRGRAARQPREVHRQPHPRHELSAARTALAQLRLHSGCLACVCSSGSRGGLRPSARTRASVGAAWHAQSRVRHSAAAWHLRGGGTAQAVWLLCGAAVPAGQAGPSTRDAAPFRGRSACVGFRGSGENLAAAVSRPTSP